MHIFYLIIYCSVLHRFFGGMRDDIKRKMPWYWSDFKDALHEQSIASFFFMYFACLTSVVTFGGLLGIATDKNMVSISHRRIIMYKIVKELVAMNGQCYVTTGPAETTLNL